MVHKFKLIFLCLISVVIHQMGIMNSMAEVPVAGPGFVLDEEKIHEFEKKAEKGDMAAIRCLFTLYAFEDGNKALSWAKKGAKLGDANFQYIVGLGLVSRDKQTEQIKGISELKKAANKNYFLAQVELARCYQEGKGVRKNLKLAEQWYRRAAFLGHKAAIFDVVQLMTTRAKDMSVLSEAYGWTLLLLRRTSAKGGQSLNENVLKPQREILEKAKKFRIAEKELILCSEKWVKDQNVRIPMTDPIDVKESPCKYLE